MLGAKGRHSDDTLHLRVLDNMREGCQLVSSDARYLYLNEAAARHGRTTKEQLLGRKMEEVYPGIEATEMFAALRRCAADGVPVSMNNEFTYPDGSKGWFELRMQYCALCGKVIPSRVWQVAIDGAERIFCDQQCEALYRSYLLAQPAAGPGHDSNAAGQIKKLLLGGCLDHDGFSGVRTTFIKFGSRE